MNRADEIEVLSRYSAIYVTNIVHQLTELKSQIDGWTIEVLETNDDLLLDRLSSTQMLMHHLIKDLSTVGSILRDDDG